MALVVFLRGVNVGGYRRFRPSVLAGQLQYLGAVNVGAAGTFVIRQPIAAAKLRAELARRLPFDAEIVVCKGKEILGLIAENPFPRQSARPGEVRFVSVLSRNPRVEPSMPVSFPSSGRWLLKILARRKQFVFGVYRRHMKVIGYLGSVDRLFDVPATTRNWNTIAAIAKLLKDGGTRSLARPAQPGRSAERRLQPVPSGDIVSGRGHPCPGNRPSKC